MRFASKMYSLATDPVAYAANLGVKIGNGCRIYTSEKNVFGSEPYLVTLGNDCFITEGVRFITHDGAVLPFRKQFPDADVLSPIVVGNNVYFGINAIILPGVTIGDNVIVGAGSVVSRSILSNTVVAGCPARPIKTFEEYRQSMLRKSLKCGKLSPSEKMMFLKDRFKC